MTYELKGGAFPVVVCQLADGEQMVTEKGSMVWMSPNMEMSTSGGGLGKMFSRAHPAPDHPARPGGHPAEGGLSGRGDRGESVRPL